MPWNNIDFTVASVVWQGWHPVDKAGKTIMQWSHCRPARIGEGSNPTPRSYLLYIRTSEGNWARTWTDSTYWRNIKWGVALGFSAAKLWFVAQQVGGIWGETTTVIHEIRPSVSRGHARTPNKTRSHSTPSTTRSHNIPKATESHNTPNITKSHITPKETERSAIDGRLFVAQQVVGSRGETTTVIHEIRPSVSRQRANTSKKTPRKRYRVPSQPSLLKLPVELRGIIFKQYLLEWTEDTLTLSVVIALRPRSQLYSEALDLFYSIKACLISPQNAAKVLAMPKSVLKRALSINLVHNLALKNDAGDSVLLKFPLGITCHPIDILQHSNIRSLQLITATIQNVEGSTNKELLSLARYAVLKLPTIVALTLKIPTDKISWRKSPQCWSWTLDFSLPIQKITRGLGIPSRWVYDNMNSIGVRWNAAINGTRTLTWTDEKYWQSIR
ncbi:hypothetical protein V8E51_004289 [Hyaloscypha variabilis]